MKYENSKNVTPPSLPLVQGEEKFAVIPRLDRGIQKILEATRFPSVQGMAKFGIKSRFEKFSASEVL
jgi:hypothetical protein